MRTDSSFLSSQWRLVSAQFRRRGARPIAAALSGVCMFLGVPEIDLWWMGFIGWIPWLWAIDRQSPRRAFFLGWLTGTIAIFGGFFWMRELISFFGGLPMPLAIAAHLLFAAAQGLQWALPAALVAWIRQTRARKGLPDAGRLWLIPLSWTLIEALLPNLFPTYMALMWCWHPLWIQHAEIGGALFVGFTMLAINVALYETLQRIAHRHDARLSATITALWLLGIPAYGSVRIAAVEETSESSEQLKIGVVQGNFGILTYANRANKIPILRALQQKSAELEREGAELILWGESAYPYSYSLYRDTTHDLPRGDSRRIRQFGMSVPLIVGAVTTDRTRKNPYPWNSAWVLDSEGAFGDRYDKNYPLMFGESVPLVDPEWYLDMIPSASYLNRGEGPGTLQAAGYRLGALICYEDLLPRFVAQTVMLDVHALVNLTNDSWFGQTDEQAEHLGLAVFRAIETRRGLVRAVNAGISAYVAPTGELEHALPVTDSDHDGFRGADGFIASVPMMDTQAITPFVWVESQWPWLPPALLCLALAATVFPPGLRFRRPVRD